MYALNSRLHSLKSELLIAVICGCVDVDIVERLRECAMSDCRVDVEVEIRWRWALISVWGRMRIPVMLMLQMCLQYFCDVSLADGERNIVLRNH
jgi:hypothetical protein